MVTSAAAAARRIAVVKWQKMAWAGEKEHSRTKKIKASSDTHVRLAARRGGGRKERCNRRPAAAAGCHGVTRRGALISDFH